MIVTIGRNNGLCRLDSKIQKRVNEACGGRHSVHFLLALEHGDVRRVPKYGCQGPIDRADYVMWRNFEPQIQNKRREKKLCSDSYAIGPTQQTNLRTYQLIGLVNGQQTLERVVLAGKPVRLRKEGLGIRVNPNADPMSKGLLHHLC